MQLQSPPVTAPSLGEDLDLGVSQFQGYLFWEGSCLGVRILRLIKVYGVLYPGLLF